MHIRVDLPNCTPDTDAIFNLIKKIIMSLILIHASYIHKKEKYRFASCKKINCYFQAKTNSYK